MTRQRRRRRREEPDREIDFHGYTAARMRSELDLRWGRGEWLGLRSVRVVHGTGAVLGAELHRWCHEKGVEFTLEAHQGATLIHPGRRAQSPAVAAHRPLAALKNLSTQTPAVRNGSGKPTAMEPADADRDTAPESAEAAWAAELERLEREDPRETRRRKHGAAASALSTQEAAAGMQETGSSGQRAAMPPRPPHASDDRTDLMAREFERLGSEHARVTRARKPDV